MPIRSIVHVLGCGVVFLSVLAGCAGVGTGESANGSGPHVSATAGSAAAQPSAREPPGAQAGLESAAAVEAKKTENVRIFRGSGVLVKPPGPDKGSAGPANISLNFEGADIRDIAKTVLGEILQESYIVDPKVQGSITFRTARPLPRSALLPTLETVLRINGVGLVKENGIFKLMPATAMRGSVSPRMGGVFAGFSVQVVPLKFLGAKEMAKILEPFAPDATAIKVDEVRNLLILAGTQNEIEHMLDTVDMFDVDWLSGMSVGLFTLQSADVKTVDAELKKILEDKMLSPLAEVVRFIPIERLNAFLMITPQPHYLEQARLWLERFDRVDSAGGGVRLFIYYVQNGKAEHLAGLLTQIFGSRQAPTARLPAPPSVAPGLAPTTITSSPGSTPGSATRPAAAAPATGATLAVTDDRGGPAGQVRVVADKENNALLILATSADYEKIESALKKLDSAPRQVLIEVTIAEVTLTDDLKYGLEWVFSNRGGRGSGQLFTTQGAAAPSVLAPGFSYVLSSAAGNIQATLNMLASENKLKILSSPHIMVADNQTAKIQVGDSVPVAGTLSYVPSTVVGAPPQAVSSVQYLDTGVILTVAPHINAGGLVNMEITQEVSSASDPGASTLNSPTISKRTAKTVVTVQSGETTVLGGIIKEDSSAGSSGLPFLSSIPIVGGLFGTQSHRQTRTELIVLITPRVAHNVGQTRMVSDEFRKKLKQTEELLNCGVSNVLGNTSRGGWWCQDRKSRDADTAKPRDK